MPNDSVSSRLTGGVFSPVVVERSAPATCLTGLSYDMTTGPNADMASMVLARPKSRPESPFGTSSARFGERRGGTTRYYTADSKPYFGRDETYEDMGFLLAATPAGAHAEAGAGLSAAGSRCASPARTARRCHTAPLSVTHLSSTRSDSMASLQRSTATLAQLSQRMENATRVAAAARAQQSLKRTRTSMHSHATKDTSAYDSLPKYMVRRLKRLEAAQAGTAFGVSGRRDTSTLLGPMADAASRTHLGPGTYSQADYNSIQSKLQSWRAQAARRAEVEQQRQAVAGPPKQYHGPGSVAFLSPAPGIGTYTLPPLRPSTSTPAWSSDDRFGRGSLGHIDKHNRYKLVAHMPDPSRRPDSSWLKKGHRPFSTSELDTRNPVFTPPRITPGSSGGARRPAYANSRAFRGTDVWEYTADLPSKPGMVQAVSARGDTYKAGRLARHKRGAWRAPSAADQAGLGPGSYDASHPTDLERRGAFQVTHRPPKGGPKSSHWLTHTDANWKIRY